MTNIALDGANGAVLLVAGVLLERLLERCNLDRIAQLGAGAMRLDQRDAVRVDLEAVVHILLQSRLRFRIGRGDAVGLAVLVHAPAFDQSKDRVAVAFGVGQALEHDHTYRFAGHKTVGALIEGVAAPVGREHAGLRGLDLHVRADHDVHAAGQRHVAVAGVQAVARVRQRHQRRGTGGVDRNARPLQVEKVGNARCQDRRCAAHKTLRAQAQLARLQLIVAAAAADKHAAFDAG